MWKEEAEEELERPWPELGQGDATWLTLEMEHDGHEPGKGGVSRSLKKEGNIVLKPPESKIALPVPWFSFRGAWAGRLGYRIIR